MDDVFPQVLFTFYGMPIRNTVISTWAMIVMIVVAVLVLRKKMPVILEMLIDIVEGVAKDYIKGPPDIYVPFLGSLIVFIAVANLSGIIPLMATPTRDINTPLALALVSLVGVFVYGIKVKGIGRFVKGFLTPMVIFDVIGYVSRTMSLTLRLFGNVLGGEIVIAVLAQLVPIGVPLIMVALSSITGILQAYVFTVLTASYLASMVHE
jgi:F-type H+-transporting ATPase subunit a